MVFPTSESRAEGSGGGGSAPYVPRSATTGFGTPLPLPPMRSVRGPYDKRPPTHLIVLPPIPISLPPPFPSRASN
eukprot:scaffold4358_cov137-Isochrysis_galbana.AAC.6